MYEKDWQPGKEISRTHGVRLPYRPVTWHKKEYIYNWTPDDSYCYQLLQSLTVSFAEQIEADSPYFSFAIAPFVMGIGGQKSWGGLLQTVCQNEKEE